MEQFLVFWGSGKPEGLRCHPGGGLDGQDRHVDSGQPHPRALHSL
jgi:hypothetical protein